MADNGLVTNVPVLQFVQCQQPGQKPWWIVWGSVGCKQKKKKTGRYGEQSEREAMEKMTTRGRVIEMEILRKRGTKHKETQ